MGIGAADTPGTIDLTDPDLFASGRAHAFATGEHRMAA
jgi:hypothetical protein